MDETDLLVVITEQAENRNPCEEQRNIFGSSFLSLGYGQPQHPQPQVVVLTDVLGVEVDNE
jgi:hypothetical protein